MTVDKDLILRTLNAALHSKKLYPPGHPSIVALSRKLYQTVADYLKSERKLSICFVEDSLVFEDAPVSESEKNYPDIIEHMKNKKVEAMIFEAGTLEKEVFSLIDVLSEEKEIHGAELQGELSSKGISHITLKSVKRNILEVYNDAIEVVKGVMDDIRSGKIPDPARVHDIAAEMEELVLSDTNAMIGLTMIKDYDNYLYNHSVNVSIIALAFARFLELPKEDLHRIGVASLLHDVGKTGVAEDIIKKPGGLSSEEWEKVKEHPVHGSNITTRMKGIDDVVSRLILEHHVRFDRSGYPKVESTLHPLSMLISVADAYDALTTIRVYQRPYQPTEAMKILKGLSGKHFDPQTVSLFEKMLGLYPVGTMVRLSTNEVAIVTKINPTASARPVVKVLYDKDGNTVAKPFEADLTASDLTIISAVDPLPRNMDAGAFFAKEAQEGI
jgi:putative nucleotidyltransferase with HDIG domain